MTKPQMMLKWASEDEAHPISRADAAHAIRHNRKRQRELPELGVKVKREHGETYIASPTLGVACCIFRAAS